MKLFAKTFFLATLCVGLVATGYAQGEDGDHFTIPLSDPARQATVDINVFAGPMSVKGYDGNEIIVDIEYNGREKSAKQSDIDTTGLKKIATIGPMIEEENNTIRIRNSQMSKISNITLQVPRRTMLVLKKINYGDITVEQVQGEIEVNNAHGNVNLSDVSGSVVAHAIHGDVKVTLLGIQPDTPCSFSSLNGNIDVSLPADLKANVSLSTGHGEIFSGFDVKTDPKRIQKQIDKSRGEESEGEINIDSTVRGTINGGGPEFQFKTFNGNIYIRKLSR